MSTATDLREPLTRFPYANVHASRPAPWPVRPLPLEVEIVGAGRVMDLDEFLEVTSTTSLVVVVDGVLVHEQYLAGTEPQHRLLGNSATKSALALMCGRAVIEGSLDDLDSPVTRWVPELAESGYGQVTLRHVLTMTTGIDWVEDHHDPESKVSKIMSSARRGEGGVRRSLTGLGPSRPPGSSYTYCTADSLVLDWVRERASGQSFVEALGWLWETVGAEHPAIIGLDAAVEEGGIPMAGSALAVSARDWARIGSLQIDGRWQGNQLIDEGWILASSRAGLNFLEPGRLPSSITTHAGFGYQWWPLDREGTRVTADGMRGQFVYVDRALRTVVVKTSGWPYDDPWWDRQCRDLSYLALPAIAEAAAGAARGL